LAYNLKIFRGQAGFEHIASAWRAIVAQMAAPHFFQQPDWYGAYLATLDPRPDDTLFGLVSHDGVPAAVLPFKQERRAVGGIKLRTLELPRHDHLHLRDIVVRDASRDALGIEQIVRLLKDSGGLKWDVLALWHVLADSCALAAHRAGAAARSIAAPRFGCSCVPLAPWSEVEARLSKNHRKNLRGAHNRTRSIEGLHIEIATTPAELDAALPALLAVEASGWKAQAGTAIRLDPQLAQFYAEVTRRFGAAGRCEISLMKIHDKPIAGLFTLMSGPTVYGPKAAYDESHGRLSPVHLLVQDLFQRLGAQRQYRQFNAISDTGWFDVWKPQRSEVHNLYVFNSTLLGLGAFAAMSVANRWRHRPATPPQENLDRAA
jgi:CelD/BcsL family acetyltransferase involved in cellulose biosynthesis